ncbi:MAG TPA: hypothetical protein VEY89_06160 [Candidatus Dormibacteraeota bacterium]|nr:hypothetical protein [Candidatus Dormibacteraeota bacterium]
MNLSPAAVHIVITLAIVALIGWRLYSRIRRSIGRQHLSRMRPWITLSVFPLLIALLLQAGGWHMPGGACLAGGVALGIVLGGVGLRLTRFEATSAGLYYTPSAHLGIALSTLLVCRVVYRLAVNGFPGAPSPAGPAPSALTPLTLALIGTLAGYYCTYAVGLLRWAARVAGDAQATPP